MGLIPENLTIWGRGAILVVAIDILTAAIGLLRMTSILVHLDELKNSTNASVLDGLAGTSPNDSTLSFTILIVLLVLYAVILLFDIVLYFGLRSGKETLLQIWYSFNIFIIWFFAATLLIQAWQLSGVAQVPSAALIIRIFETWIIREYLRELDSRGGIYNPNLQQTI